MQFFAGGSDPGTAKKQVGKENDFAQGFSDKGGQSWNALFPALNQDINNPQGFSQQEKTNMNTSASQSLGGSVAGAVGQGNLTAGRTHNPGSMGAALDQSSRQAGQTLSTHALGVEEASANLAHEKQQMALKEMGALYGTNVSGLSDMLHAANQALSVYETAKTHEGSVMRGLSQMKSLFAPKSSMDSEGGTSSDYTSPFGGG